MSCSYRLRSGAASASQPSVAASATAQPAAAAQLAASSPRQRRRAASAGAQAIAAAASASAGTHARRQAQVEAADERRRTDVDERIAGVQRGAEQVPGDDEQRPAGDGGGPGDGRAHADRAGAAWRTSSTPPHATGVSTR